MYVSACGVLVVTTILKTSNESGVSAEAAVIPRLLPRGRRILEDSKQSLVSTETLRPRPVCSSFSWDGRPRLR